MTFIHRTRGTPLLPPPPTTAIPRRPPIPYPPTFHALAHSSALFCTRAKLNAFVFRDFCTLSQKLPGVGVPLWNFLPVGWQHRSRRPATMLLHEVPRLHHRNDLHDDGPPLRRTGDHRCVRRSPGVLVRSLREPGTLCRLHAEADQVYRGTLVAHEAIAAGPAPLSAMRNGPSAGSRHGRKHAVDLLAMRGR